MKYLFIAIGLFLTTTLFAQPANDNPCGAILIPIAVNVETCTQNVYNYNSTPTPTTSTPVLPPIVTASCGFTTFNPATTGDVWYLFKPNTTSVYFSMSPLHGSNFTYATTPYALYRASTCNSPFTFISCGNQSQAPVKISNLVPDSIYYLRIFLQQTPGTHEMCIYTDLPPASIKVGINVISPQKNVDISGEAQFRNDAFFNKNVKVEKMLDVMGPANFYSTVNCGIDLSVGSQLLVGGIASIGASTSIGGMLTVGLDANLQRNLTVYDGLTVGRNVSIGETASIGSSASIGGTLTVGLNTTLQRALTVYNELSVGSSASIGGIASIGSNTSIGGGLYVDGDISAQGNSRIQMSNTLGNRISIWGSISTAHYGFGVQSGLLQIHSDVAGSDIAFGTGSSASFSETMRIKGNGRVGIGTSNPLAPLSFPPTLEKKITLYPGGTGDVGMAVQGNYFQIYSDNPNASVGIGYQQNAAISAGNPTGFQYNLNILGNGNATLRGTLTQNSDMRLKKDIHPLENSLQKISQLTGYGYYWKASDLDNSQQIGLLAQEVKKVFPQLVKEDANGTLSVNYTGLIPVLLESIKTQQQQIEDLKENFRKYVSSHQ